ncbi:MAG: DUF4290 domain-containing protein [Bacteroidales bacterium]|nr:DUF4290 domain-containing protein [Bacteroidales bacterium]
MEYNTTRDKLVISEYGRNVQKLIKYAITIEDRKKRTDFTKIIVQIMGQMNPQVRDSGDFRHKLWDHLFIIADFKLDVDSPYPPPSIEFLTAKPEKLSYRENNIDFKIYGTNISKIIEVAIDFEEGPEKDALVHTIANHLKKSYLNWNRDSVSDDLIIEHLNTLSKGKLKLSEDRKLNATSDILARNRKKKPSKPGTQRGKDQRKGKGRGGRRM